MKIPQKKKDNILIEQKILLSFYERRNFFQSVFRLVNQIKKLEHLIKKTFIYLQDMTVNIYDSI